jgi:hypothetical protein
MLRRCATLGAGTLALLSALGARAAPADVRLGVHFGVHLGVHLSWVRDESAAGCPDAAAIETQVAGRLDDNPFIRAPGLFIEATVRRDAGLYRASIAMRDRDGTLVGSRALTSGAADCGSIAAAAALTIAILIDPDALVRPPPAPAPPAPAPPAVPTPAAPAPAERPAVAGRVVLSALGGAGLLPRAALGAAISATVDLGRRAAVGAAVGFFPERRFSDPSGDFAFGLSSGELTGCFVPHAGHVRWELCAGVLAGALHAVVYAPEPVRPGQRWYGAATQLTRVVVPIRGALVVEAGLEALEPFPRRSFFVEGRPAGMDTVFTQPYVAVAGWAGVGLKWR